MGFATGFTDRAIQPMRFGVGSGQGRYWRRRCADGVYLDQFTPSELRSLAPPPTHWSAQLAGALARSLTEYLEERGELASPPTSPTIERVAVYGRYLESVRGLASATVVRQARQVSEFLRFLEYDARPQRLAGLEAADVESFIAHAGPHAGRHLGRASMQKVTSRLRDFLRFLALKEEGPSGLDAHLDSPRCFRGERLPRALSWEVVRSLLRSIDRSTPKGRRDYAMRLLIATYGIRVSEVAALRLDDLAWRSQRIWIPRPKIGTPLLLLLTDEVATAWVEYLRLGRAPAAHRHLFLRVRAPLGPIESTAVCDAFDVWATHAGIQLPPRSGGPHCLRHSVATYLLRHGTSVKTIGDLLGHRSAEATSVYLRLQVEDLRDVALPLPETVDREEKG